MRGSSCPCARALVLAAAALVVTSSSYVADGLIRAGSSADAAGRLDGSVDDGYKPNQATMLLHGSSKTVEDELALARKRAASGSRLPDCAHACGACSPCRRVMVSFKCAESASESCPIAYRCLCRGRFFRVPSL